jgi:hypothetical protein
VAAAVVIVIGFIVFVILVVSDKHSPASTATAPPVQGTTVSLGQLVTLSDADRTGIASARVLSISAGVATADGGRPGPGRQLVAVDVEICAGSRGSVGPDLSRFTLVLPVGLAFPVADLATMSPSLWQFDSLAADQCQQGYLSYDLASSVQPTTVRYAASPGQVVLWRA